MQPNYLRRPYRMFWVRLGFMIICHSGLLPTLYNCQVLDDQNFRRRFRVSNYRTTTRVNPFVCTMPIRLEVGWNQIQFNLSDLTRRAYGTRYIETLRVQVNSFRCKNVLAKYLWKFLTFVLGFFSLLSDSCELQNKEGVFHRQTILRGWASCRVQTLPAYTEPEEQGQTHTICWFTCSCTTYIMHLTPFCVCVFWFLEAVEIFDRHRSPVPDTLFLLNAADLAELCQIRRTECKSVEINQYIFDAFKLLLARSLYLIVYFSNCVIICPPLWWTFVLLQFWSCTFGVLSFL